MNIRLSLLLALLCGWVTWAEEIYKNQKGRFVLGLRRGPQMSWVNETLKSHHGRPDAFLGGQQVLNSNLTATGEQGLTLALVTDAHPPTNLRAEPEGRIIGRLDPLEPLIVLKRGDWLQILTPRGIRGYVHTSVVSQMVLGPQPELVAAILKPVQTDHARTCSVASSDPRHHQSLRVHLGPLGVGCIDTKGKLVPVEQTFQNLSNGASENKEWVVVSIHQVFKPTDLSDLSFDYLLQRTASGKYRIALRNFNGGLRTLQKVGVPPKVIAALSLPQFRPPLNPRSR